MEAICQEVAAAYLSMTANDFDKWLARKTAANPGSDYELIWSGHLAGILSEEWARDHASPAATRRLSESEAKENEMWTVIPSLTAYIVREVVLAEPEEISRNEYRHVYGDGSEVWLPSYATLGQAMSDDPSIASARKHHIYVHVEN